jgi:hypothetical protein
MYASTLATLALLGAASAQTTTSLFLPGFDEQSIVASILGSVCACCSPVQTKVILICEKDATATTYSLNCGNTDSEDCGIPPVSDQKSQCIQANANLRSPSVFHFHTRSLNHPLRLQCQRRWILRVRKLQSRYERALTLRQNDRSGMQSHQ